MAKKTEPKKDKDKKEKSKVAIKDIDTKKDPKGGHGGDPFKDRDIPRR